VPPHWHGDPEYQYRPSPPYEWTCHVIASNYNTTPYQAHRELGGGTLTPRQRRRLTIASTDLAGLSAAFDDVDRDRSHDPKSHPDLDNVKRVREALDLMAAAETDDLIAFNAAVQEGAARLAALGITALSEPTAGAV
jgi:hypothetical protein